MDRNLFESFRELQATIRSIGLGGTVVSFHSSNLDPDSDSPQGQGNSASKFSQIIVEDEIVSVSRDLFESGFYNQAIDEAFKVLEAKLQERASLPGEVAEDLARLAFVPDQPLLMWSDGQSKSQKDEQAGYYQLFSGAFLGISKPVRNEIGWINDPVLALDCMSLIQHLIRKLNLTHNAPAPSKSII